MTRASICHKNLFEFLGISLREPPLCRYFGALPSRLIDQPALFGFFEIAARQSTAESIDSPGKWPANNTAKSWSLKKSSKCIFIYVQAPTGGKIVTGQARLKETNCATMFHASEFALKLCPIGARNAKQRHSIAINKPLKFRETFTRSRESYETCGLRRPMSEITTNGNVQTPSVSDENWPNSAPCTEFTVLH